MAVVDLHGGRPLASSSSSAGGGASARRYRQCSLHYVDPQLYMDRPGLAVHQVGGWAGYQGGGELGREVGGGGEADDDDKGFYMEEPRKRRF